jgi:galactose oxidase
MYGLGMLKGLVPVLALFSLAALSSPGAMAATTTIVVASSSLCAAFPAGNTSPNTAVATATCLTPSPSDENFTLVPYNGNYNIVSQQSGQCLNIANNSQGAGSTIIQWPCQTNGQLNDQWTFTPVGGYYEIISAYTGQCLNVSNNSYNTGAVLIQWPCQNNGQLNDRWTLSVLTGGGPKTLPSTWSPVITLPVLPVAIANLPNGNLLMWSAYNNYTYEGDIGYSNGQTYTGIFNPATNTASEVLVTNTGDDMFCPGTANLVDGTVLVNGGSSSPKTSLFAPTTGLWSTAATMNIPRGYEGDTMLSTGAVLTLGGSWTGGYGGKTGEVWSPTTGWVLKSGIPETNVIGPDPQGVYRGDNHLWLFASSGGSVFHAGPSNQMNWITTTGNGTITPAGTRGTDPFSINGNAALYDVGKILKAGGAPSYQQDGGTTYATTAAYLIDISAGALQPPKVTQLPSMTYRRAFSSAVVLPNGNVVVVGGQSVPQPFTDTTAILVPEIWDPVAQTFSLLNPMQTPRTYHSTAILLPDGRVFVGGGGLCGYGCAQNHLNAEILTPPYLLNADGSAAVRPTITAAETNAGLGSTMSVTTNVAVSSFAIMRLSSITHTTNNDQRRIPLAIVSTNGTTYGLAIPADPGVVLPGYYMLFALNAAGVPSISTTVNIQ